MRKWTGCMLLICLFIFSGCMNSESSKDEDVAAIVRGEEITIDHLRLLYSDDAIADMIDEAVKAKLAEQEVKKMNIDVSKKVKELKKSYGTYPKDEQHNTKAQSIRAFADPQAKKLHMDPEEYYKKYTEASTEKSAYINTYVAEVLGELEDDELGIEEYKQHENELLEDLVENNKDKIDIRIK